MRILLPAFALLALIALVPAAEAADSCERQADGMLLPVMVTPEGLNLWVFVMSGGTPGDYSGTETALVCTGS